MIMLDHPYLTAAGYALAFFGLGWWFSSIFWQWRVRRMRSLIDLQKLQLGGMK